MRGRNAPAIGRALPAWIVLALLAAGSLAAEDRFPAGQIVEKVACRSDPRFSFALYLPSAFEPGRPWPLLLLLDARGRGALAAERFRAAAERFGWIVISSNDSRSDDAAAPNAEVLKALWAEALGRFPADPRRIYAGGFSGGARLAFVVAFARPAAVAGVIAASGGLPSGEPLREAPPFSIFLTAGDRDFNYLEMRSLDRALEKAGGARRMAVFPGGHDWPPAEVASRAVAWMEVEAARRGLRPKDPRLFAELFGQAAAAAREKEASGDVAGAWEAFAGAARDFDGLTATEAAREGASRLEKSAVALLEQNRRRDERERDASRRVLQTLDSVLASEEPVSSAAAARRLDIDRWRREAATGTPAGRLSAERILETLGTAAGFYRPQAYFAKGDPRRAAASLSIAAAAHPDRGAVWYRLACARARARDGAGAVEALRIAIEKGFRDVALIRSDPDLAAIRGRGDYEALVAGLGPSS